MEKLRERLLGYGKHYSICRLICCVMLFALVNLTACSTGASNDDNISREDNSIGIASASTEPVSTLQKPEWVYVPERIEIRDKRADYDAMQLVGDTVCYLSMNGEAEGETQNICQYSLADRELKSIPIDWKDDGSIREISCYTFDENRNTWLVVNVYSADFGQFRRFLYKFDSEGKNLFFQNISEQLGSGTSVSGMAVDEKGRIYVFNPEAGICLYAEDGSYYGTISYDSSGDIQARGTVSREDGRLYVCISKGEKEDHCALMEVDFEKKQLTESIKDFQVVNGICADSSGQYDFLMYDDIAAYGYHLSMQKAEELFVWGDSDINGYFVKYMNLLEDGRYFCAVEDWAYDDRSVVLLTKTKAEEAPLRLDLVLATVDGGSDMAGMAVTFNRNNNQYHITVKNYDSLTNLYNAILAKEVIDIIDLSGVNVENLSRQGVFADLTPYLEQSETFSASDFLDGILDVYTFDSTLVGIPESFRLRTVVGDRSKLGNDTGLTLEGLLATAGDNPGAMPFDEITKEEMMQYLMMFNEDAFIEWDKGECHFDSEQFKAVLEFVKKFPDSIGSGQEVSLPSKIQNGDVLFAIADMRGVKAFQLYEEIFGEKAACVGFPTPDGKGGTLLFGDNAFGIAVSSENKSGAWDFIESVLKRRNTDGMNNEEIYHAYYYYPGLRQYPTMKKAMSAITDYIMETDKARKFGTRIYDDGWKFTSHAVTWDEINVILDLVPNATPFFSVKDDEIIKIINEEAGAYYSGQKGIEDVVRVIQNRVQLYVNENM